VEGPFQESQKGFFVDVWLLITFFQHFSNFFWHNQHQHQHQMAAFSSATLPPDSAIRLASALHCYALPRVEDSSRTSYQRAFKTSGKHAKTSALLRKLDETRVSLCCALTGAKGKIDGGIAANAADEYLPCIRQLLLSCEVQPDGAMLDEKLEFCWQSSLENPKSRKSEALMFEVGMAVATKAAGHVSKGVDKSVDGEFDVACNQFRIAAGVMDHLANVHLPQWISLGSSVQLIDLPSEVVAPCCEGFRSLYLAHAQQMAIAKHMQGAKVNYSILSKLCLGCSEM